MMMAELHLESADKLRSKGKPGARLQAEALTPFQTHIQANPSPMMSNFSFSSEGFMSDTVGRLPKYVHLGDVHYPIFVT